MNPCDELDEEVFERLQEAVSFVSKAARTLMSDEYTFKGDELNGKFRVAPHGGETQ